MLNRMKFYKGCIESGLFLCIILVLGCQKTDQQQPVSSSAGHVKSTQSAPVPVYSDIILYQYLMADTPLMNKLSLEAKEELLSSAQFELRGFFSTGNMHSELTDSECDEFIGYAVGIGSTRILRSNFDDPGHPLAALFAKMSPATKTHLVNSGQYLFHGFKCELLMRKEFNCKEYKAFYDYLLNTDVEIVTQPGDPCQCLNEVYLSFFPDGVGGSGNPCQCGTKELKDKVWDHGTTWTASDCKDWTGGGCIVCKDCTPSGN